MDSGDKLEEWISIRDDPFRMRGAVGPYRHHGDGGGGSSGRGRQRGAELCFRVSRAAGDSDAEPRYLVSCRDLTGGGAEPAGKKEEPAGKREEPPRTAVFTCHELYGIHSQLLLVQPAALAGTLLPLPLRAKQPPPRGLWAYLVSDVGETSGGGGGGEDDDFICSHLMAYFENALERCGKCVMIETLFEQNSLDDYFENIGSLRRRRYDHQVELCLELLDNVMLLRDGCIGMHDMVEIYREEDAAVLQWNISTSQLYNYLIQPFLDMREVSLANLRTMNISFSDSETYIDSRTNYIHSLDRIQELYIDYFQTTTALINEQLTRMSEDRQLYGVDLFSRYAQVRYSRVSEQLHLENLQLFTNRRIYYENQRDKSQQEMVSLLDTDRPIDESLSNLEDEVYQWHLKIHESSMTISREKELLHKFHIDAIQKNIDDKNELFYDAYEDLTSIPTSLSDTLLGDATRLQSMLADRGKYERVVNSLSRRRANIRNKMNVLRVDRDKQLKQRRLPYEHVQSHHNIQFKLDQQKMESNKKTEFINGERIRTIERLRKYKLKYPTQPTLYTFTTDPADLADPQHFLQTTESGATTTTATTADSKVDGKYWTGFNDKVKKMIISEQDLQEMSAIVMNKSRKPHKYSRGWGTLSSSATEAGDGSSAKEACVRSAYVEETAGARVEKVKHAATKDDQLDEMMRNIRAGVKLRPVGESQHRCSGGGGRDAPLSLVDLHAQQLRAAFARISDKLRLSEDDDDEDSDFDGCDYFD